MNQYVVPIQSAVVKMVNADDGGSILVGLIEGDPRSEHSDDVMWKLE